MIASRSGELSVLADSYAITAKALRPLPEKHHGLSDPEARVRQRYVDLIVNPDARRMAELRGAVTRSLRRGTERARLPRGGDAGAADGARRGERPARSAPRSTPTTWSCTCGSRWSCTSSG